MHVLWLRYLTEINEKTRQIPQELLDSPEINKAVIPQELLDSPEINKAVLQIEHTKTSCTVHST